MWIYSLISFVIITTSTRVIMPSDFVSLYAVPDTDVYESSEEALYSVVNDTNTTQRLQKQRAEQAAAAAAAMLEVSTCGLVPGQVADAPRLFVPMKRTTITNNRDHHPMMSIQDQDLDMSISGLTSRIYPANLTVPGQVDDQDQCVDLCRHVNNVYDFSAPPSASNSLASLLTINDTQEDVINKVEADLSDLDLSDYPEELDREEGEDLDEVAYQTYIDSTVKRDNIWSGVYKSKKYADVPDKKVAKMSPTKLLKLAVGVAENQVLANKDGTGAAAAHSSFLGALQEALSPVSEFQDILRDYPNPRYSTGSICYCLTSQFGDCLAMTYLKAFMTKVQDLIKATRKVARINKILHEARTALEAALGQWTGNNLETIRLREDLRCKGVPRSWKSRELLTFFRVCAVRIAKKSNTSKAEAKVETLTKLVSVRATLTSLVNHLDRSSAWSAYDATTVPMNGYDAPDIYLVAFVAKTQAKLDKAKDIKSKLQIAKTAKKQIENTIRKTKKQLDTIVKVEDAAKTVQATKFAKIRQNKQALDKAGKDHLIENMLKQLTQKCKKTTQKEMIPVLKNLENALTLDLKSMKFLEEDLQNVIDTRGHVLSVIDNLPWEDQHRHFDISVHHHTDEELHLMEHEVYQRALLKKLHLILKKMDNPQKMIKMISKSYIQVKEALDNVRKLNRNSN